MEVKGISIKHKNINKNDYISLSDIARFREGEFPSDVIRAWLRTYRTIEFLGIWEQLHNPDFNSVEFDRVKTEAPRNGFIMTPTRWVETTNAIGIIQSMGKYADILAHKDIAFKFASWLSVEFELYMIIEFQRFKENEQAQLQWTARRELSKLNYHLQTGAIKNSLVPILTEQQRQFVYQNEADILNVALFGHTALEWRKSHPKEAEQGFNVRDFANHHELLVLAFMENANAEMIKQGIKQSDRIQELNNIARYQLPILMEINNTPPRSPLLLEDKNKKP